MQLRKRNGFRRRNYSKLVQPLEQKEVPRVVVWKMSWTPSTEKERVDTRALHSLRDRLLRIRASHYEKRLTFLLLLAFFKEFPLEELGERTMKEIALSISRGSMSLDESLSMLEMYEIATETLSRAEVLCEKLQHVGFPTTKEGLQKASRLHLAIKHWTRSLQQERRIHNIAA